MRKKLKTKSSLVRSKTKKAVVAIEPPKRWRGIVVLDKDVSRISVHPLRNRDGSRLEPSKLKEIMDRQFDAEAPHRVFYVIEMRDEHPE
jgi:hypothetical protein